MLATAAPHRRHRNQSPPQKSRPAALIDSVAAVLSAPTSGRAIGHSPPSGDTPRYHPAGQKASAHALLDGCGWAPTVPSPTLFNPGASAEVTPGRGELPALVSMLLANYCDGEALHVYQSSLPPRIAIRGLDCSAL